MYWQAFACDLRCCSFELRDLGVNVLGVQKHNNRKLRVQRASSFTSNFSFGAWVVRFVPSQRTLGNLASRSSLTQPFLHRNQVQIKLEFGFGTKTLGQKGS